MHGGRVRLQGQCVHGARVAVMMAERAIMGVRRRVLSHA